MSDGVERRQVERRIADQDPVEVLTPEVFALLKLCGGLRATDTQTGREHLQSRVATSDRRRGDRRRDPRAGTPDARRSG